MFYLNFLPKTGALRKKSILLSYRKQIRWTFLFVFWYWVYFYQPPLHWEERALILLIKVRLFFLSVNWLTVTKDLTMTKCTIYCSYGHRKKHPLVGLLDLIVVTLKRQCCTQLVSAQLASPVFWRSPRNLPLSVTSLATNLWPHFIGNSIPTLKKMKIFAFMHAFAFHWGSGSPCKRLHRQVASHGCTACCIYSSLQALCCFSCGKKSCLGYDVHHLRSYGWRVWYI